MNHSNISMENTTEASSGGSSFTGLLEIKIGVLSVILFLALFGNIFVLVVLKIRVQKHSRMQWYIVHLCITDIFVALCNVMPQLIRDINGRFIGDDFSCRLVSYLQVVAMYASSYVLLMLAIDRYISICHPFTSYAIPPKIPRRMIIVAWVLSLLFSIPQLIIFRYMYVDNRGWDCSSRLSLTEDWMIHGYVTWSFLSTYIIPFFILVFCYGRICPVIWEYARPMKNIKSLRKPQRTIGSVWHIFGRSIMNSNDNYIVRRNTTDPVRHNKKRFRIKMKTIKLSLMVVVCYLICWGPFYVTQMWWAFDADAPISTWAFRIFLLLASLNSCTNPWIYLAYSGIMCKKREQVSGVPRSATATSHLSSTSDRDSRYRSTQSSNYDISERSSQDGSVSGGVIITSL